MKLDLSLLEGRDASKQTTTAPLVEDITVDAAQFALPAVKDVRTAAATASHALRKWTVESH